MRPEDIQKKITDLLNHAENMDEEERLTASIRLGWFGDELEFQLLQQPLRPGAHQDDLLSAFQIGAHMREIEMPLTAVGKESSHSSPPEAEAQPAMSEEMAAPLEHADARQAILLREAYTLGSRGYRLDDEQTETFFDQEELRSYESKNLLHNPFRYAFYLGRKAAGIINPNETEEILKAFDLKSLNASLTAGASGENTTGDASTEAGSTQRENNTTTGEPETPAEIEQKRLAGLEQRVQELQDKYRDNRVSLYTIRELFKAAQENNIPRAHFLIRWSKNEGHTISEEDMIAAYNIGAELMRLPSYAQHQQAEEERKRIEEELQQSEQQERERQDKLARQYRNLRYDVANRAKDTKVLLHMDAAFNYGEQDDRQGFEDQLTRYSPELQRVGITYWYQAYNLGATMNRHDLLALPTGTDAENVLSPDGPKRKGRAGRIWERLRRKRGDTVAEGSIEETPPIDTQTPPQAPENREKRIAALQQQFDELIARAGITPGRANDLKMALARGQRGDEKALQRLLKPGVKDLETKDEDLYTAYDIGVKMTEGWPTILSTPAEPDALLERDETSGRSPEPPRQEAQNEDPEQGYQQLCEKYKGDEGMPLTLQAVYDLGYAKTPRSEIDSKVLLSHKTNNETEDVEEAYTLGFRARLKEAADAFTSLLQPKSDTGGITFSKDTVDGEFTDTDTYDRTPEGIGIRLETELKTAREAYAQAELETSQKRAQDIRDYLKQDGSKVSLPVSTSFPDLQTELAAFEKTQHAYRAALTAYRNHTAHDIQERQRIWPHSKKSIFEKEAKKIMRATTTEEAIKLYNTKGELKAKESSNTAQALIVAASEAFRRGPVSAKLSLAISLFSYDAMLFMAENSPVLTETGNFTGVQNVLLGAIVAGMVKYGLEVKHNRKSRKELKTLTKDMGRKNSRERGAQLTALLHEDSDTRLNDLMFAQAGRKSDERSTRRKIATIIGLITSALGYAL